MDDLLLALRVVVSLGVVVALLWVVQRRLAKGGRRPQQAAAVRLVGRQGVAGKSSVVVVEVEGERLVLGVTEQGMSVLARHAVVPEPGIPQPTDAESATEAGSRTGATVSPFVRTTAAPVAPSWAAVWQRALGTAAPR